MGTYFIILGAIVLSVVIIIAAGKLLKRSLKFVFLLLFLIAVATLFFFKHFGFFVSEIGGNIDDDKLCQLIISFKGDGSSRDHNNIVSYRCKESDKALKDK